MNLTTDSATGWLWIILVVLGVVVLYLIAGWMVGNRLSHTRRRDSRPIRNFWDAWR